MRTPAPSRREFLRQIAVPAAGALALAASGEKSLRAATGPALLGQTTPGPIIDSHVHVWKADPRYPWAPESADLPDRDATPGHLLDLMRSAGVQRTVIIQVKYYRWDNRYAAATLKKYPQYFRGVARVNPEDPAATDHLSLLTEGDGFRGVRLSPADDPSGDWIRGPLMAPLWGRCRDLGVPMTILASSRRMADVGRLAERFPDLTIVIDHMANCHPDRPKEIETVLALSRWPRIYVKISGSWGQSRQPYPYLDAQEQIRRLYHTFGPRRLMAGTDWPLVEKYCTYAQAIDLARSRIAFFNAEDRRWICGKTAETVWFS